MTKLTRICIWLIVAAIVIRISLTVPTALAEQGASPAALEAINDLFNLLLFCIGWPIGTALSEIVIDMSS